jgi:hypothetical protein
MLSLIATVPDMIQSSELLWGEVAQLVGQS